MIICGLFHLIKSNKNILMCICFCEIYFKIMFNNKTFAFLFLEILRICGLFLHCFLWYIHFGQYADILKYMYECRCVEVKIICMNILTEVLTEFTLTAVKWGLRVGMKIWSINIINLIMSFDFLSLIILIVIIWNTNHVKWAIIKIQKFMKFCL